MADTGSNSDLDTFQQLFGSFELYLPAENEPQQFEISPEIQALLDLPFPDVLGVNNENESETKSETETETDNAVNNENVSLSEPNIVVNGGQVLNTEQQNELGTDLHQDPAVKPENSSRFKTLNDQDLDAIRQNKYASKTQQNTKWGVNLFQEWCTERLGQKVDLDTISKQDLNNYLKRFYAEAAPKITDTRKRKFESDAVCKEYHRNTLKNARAAINRYFRDKNLSIDIVKDSAFQEANDMLDAKIKTNLKSGLNMPVQHKPIIPPEHMIKIHKYLTTTSNPITLRYRIWFILSVQYVSRGLEFHPQLNKNSLKVCTDENGMEFVTLSHEVQEKQNQGGVENTKRMYALGPDEKEHCPVQALKLYLSKCDPNAEKLFCQVNKLAMENPDFTNTWFTSKPLGQRQFSSFMSDICRNAGLQERYTAHCLRATATQGLDDAGFELRHIMFMTGHRNEASVRSYNRGVHNQTKQKLSNILTNITMGKSSENVGGICEVAEHTSKEAEQTTSHVLPATVVVPTKPVVQTTPGPAVSTLDGASMNMSMFNPSTCSFSNCTFNLSGGYKLDK